MILIFGLIPVLLTLSTPSVVVSTGCLVDWTMNSLESMCNRQMDKKQYAEALEVCSSIGGRIVMPKSEQDYKSLLALITSLGIDSNGKFWIGLKKQDNNSYIWDNGTVFDSTSYAEILSEFNTNDENNMCVISENAVWEDHDCTHTHMTVCQTDGTTTAHPGTTTAPPGTTTAPPGTTTAPPGTTTAPPGTTIVPPGTTTAPPGTTTAPPGTTTAPSGTTTAPPRTTTAPPGTTIAPPGTTNAPPGTTTAPPGTTTSPPERTTAPPGTTAAPPGITCPKEISLNSNGISIKISDYADNSTTLTRTYVHYELLDGKLEYLSDIGPCRVENDPVYHFSPSVSNGITYLQTNGISVKISGNRYNDTMIYSCEEQNFTRVWGNLYRTCTENGTWSGKEPVCEKFHCPYEPLSFKSKARLMIMKRTDNYIDTLRYSCKAPFCNHVEGNLKRRCTANGNWTGTEPVCRILPRALIYVTELQQNYTLACDCDITIGSPISGDLSTVCIDETLNEAEPKCQRCNCSLTRPTTITTEQVDEMIKDMKIDTKKTSKSIRQKTSAGDDRPSAQTVGYVGMIMLVITGLVIIVPDLPRLYADIKHGFQNIKSFFDRF